MSNRINEKIQVNSPEFFFALSYFFFALIKPVLLQNVSISKIILMFAMIVLMGSSVASFKFKLTKNKLVLISTIIGTVCLLFVFDFFVRPNPKIGEYFYNYAIYGIIPLILLVNVKNFRAVLFWWTMLSIITGLMYLGDPFVGYRWMGGYMPFGFEAMLPAFAGTCIALFYYRKKIIIPLMIVIFIETVVFANKGAIIACVAIFVFSYCYSAERIRVKRVFFIVAIGSCLLLVRNTILSLFVNVAKQWGVRSYSLITISEAIGGSGNGLFDGRNGVWEDVIVCIKQKLFFGYGIGGIEWKIGNYAHNFFLDIIVTFGVCISFFIVLFLIYLLKKVYRMQNQDLKYFGLVMFVLWFFPLQFSLTFWKVSAFWIFIAISLLKNSNLKEE